MKTLFSLFRPQQLMPAILAFACASTFAALPIPTTPATGAIAAGYAHTVTLKSDGTVWTWGSNANGQLGDGTTTQRSVAVQVSGLNGIVAVVAGHEHTVALKSDGTVWTWGDNAYGQLGNGTTTQRSTAVRVSGLSGIVAVKGGRAHTVALKSDGTVWAWGDNSYGQIGDGSTSQRTAPVQVSGLNSAVALAAGNGFTMALKSDGTVWACGVNGTGQLGDGTTTNRATPVRVSGLSGVVGMAAGSGFTVALKNDTTAWAWGDNMRGYLGDGTTSTRTIPVRVSGLIGVAEIVTHGSHTVARKSDGTVWAWGYNAYGQLGDGTTFDRATPVLVSALSGVVSLATGDYHSLALKSDGTVWTWGYNAYGQLGHGTTATTAQRPTAIQVSGLNGIGAVATGRAQTVVARSDGTVWGWGYNMNGQLGDGTNVSRSTAAPMTGLSGGVAVASGYDHTLALKSDGTVWSCGRNAWGQLGDGTNSERTTVVKAGGLTGVVAVAAGANFSAAVESDGTVWTWGDNYFGQLGDGTTTTRFTAGQVRGLTGVVAVAAGSSHIVAVKNDGSVWAWGANFSGGLGDGTATRRSTPVSVSGLSDIVAVAAASKHTVALKSDGTVWAWGGNDYGQLGDGTTMSHFTARQVSGLTGVIAIAAGVSHTVVVKNDGSVWAWGDNLKGQLGDGTTTQRLAPVSVNALTDVIAISAGDSFSVALRRDGSLRGCGNNADRQLAIAHGEPTPVAICLISSGSDTDQDGLGDNWETQYFGNLGHNGVSDTDGDGLTDIQEFAKGSDPTQADKDGDALTDFVDPYPDDFYNATLPLLTVVGGDNQTAEPNAFNAQPLDVAVWNGAATAPLFNAPVTFAVSSGDGSLATSLDASLVPSLTLRADQDGTAQVYFKHGSAFGTLSTVTITAGNAQSFIRSTTASKQDQTINFADPGPQSFDAPLALSATASSGLPVRFDATSGPVMIANGLASFTGAGTVTITAKQDGNSTYNAAPDIAHTFIVNLGSQSTVTVSPSTASIGVGGSATFTASGGVNGYVWGGRASGTGSAQTVIFNSVGTFEVTVYAQADGRYAQSNTATAIVAVTDTTPPVIAAPDNLVVEATGSDGAVVTFEPSATDSVDGPVAVSASPTSGSTFPFGTSTVALSATDAAGNTATSGFTVTVRDTTAPTITLLANQTLEATGPDGAIATFNAAAHDQISGLVAVTYSIPSGSSFALGTTTITAIATDAAGNTATETFTVTVRDTTAPVLTLPETITAQATSAAGATVPFIGGATDLVGGNIPITYSPAANSVFPLGETAVTATAADAAGNIATATVLVKVVDSIAPILTLPADLSVEATGPTGATVTFAASATDVVSGDLSVSYSAEPGTLFQLGETTVTVTAIDATGNLVTGSFKITVRDTTAPTIAVPVNQTLNATGPTGAIATYSASANDLVGGPVAVSGSPVSGSTFALGVTPVTITATDAAGNSATRTFTVTVRDTSAPVITLPANQTLEATDLAGAVATYSASARDLVDGAVPVSISPASGSTFARGVNTVTVTATDAVGNTTRRSFTVTVRDIVAPTIATQPLSQVVAVGSRVTLNVVAGSTRFVSYQWMFGSAAISGATDSGYTIPSAQVSNTGSYKVVLTNTAGTVTSKTVTLSVLIPPTIATQPTDLTATAGKTATFRVVASGSSTLKYQWYFNGSAITGATSSSYTVTAQPAKAGAYSVSVTNAIGSVSSIAATLTVNNPVVITSQPASQSITLGNPVTFNVAASGTSPLSYQWRLGNVAIAGANSSSYTIAAALAANAGSYTVVVTNPAGSVPSSAAVLKVNTPPAITTQPTSKAVTAGTTVTFKVVATGTATLTYQWKLNDVPVGGATAASFSVLANTSTVGTYSVVVTNVAGAATSSPATLTLK